MGNKTLTMSWNQRLALIDHFQPTDEAVCAAFSLTMDELETARVLRSAGTFSPDLTFDVTPYRDVFVNAVATAAQHETTSVNLVVTDGTTAQKTTTDRFAGAYAPAGATVHTRPETATKRVREPQKRGRKGDKIVKALAAVPTAPVPVDTFIAEHGVSLAVLRQSKRFVERLEPDVQRQIGKVNVRQDKTTKQLMIWREITD